MRFCDFPRAVAMAAALCALAGPLPTLALDDVDGQSMRFSGMTYGRSAAFADVDADGDLDAAAASRPPRSSPPITVLGINSDVTIRRCASIPSTAHRS